jgi:NodT family efflux transporter outer membrane factor (OMF) lipoprotein
VPLTVPSELVRQRPDILAVEAQLHAASAEIGVATAALYPHLTLTGTYGWDNTSPSPLFAGPNAIWLYGAQLAAPLFHGGTLWFKRRSAIDSYQQSFATYRQTVLAALAQVADLLRALEHDAEQVAAQARQEKAAHEALRLTSVNYQSGVASYLEVLISDVQENQAMIASIGGRAQRLQDSVALFVALGGGWWNAKDVILQE